MIPDELQEVIDEMAEWLGAEEDPGLDKIAEWRKKLESHKKMIDSTVEADAVTVNVNHLVINPGTVSNALAADSKARV